MKTIKRWILPIAAILIVADFVLLLTSYRLLVHEQRGVAVVNDFSKGIWGEAKQPTLTCTYWTGRSVRKITFGRLGERPDECPFIYRPTYFRDGMQ